MVFLNVAIDLHGKLVQGVLSIGDDFHADADLQESITHCAGLATQDFLLKQVSDCI